MGEQQPLGPRDCASVQQGHEAPAIHFRPGRRADAAQLQQGRIQIDVRRDFVDDARLFESRRPLHPQRNAGAAFMHAAFAPAHPGVVAVRIGAVIGEVENNRVLAQVEAL